MATDNLIGLGLAIWCIGSVPLGVLIGKWLTRCAARDPLHDLSDKQADFASVDDEILIERAVAVYHGEKF